MAQKPDGGAGLRGYQVRSPLPIPPFSLLTDYAHPPAPLVAQMAGSDFALLPA